MAELKHTFANLPVGAWFRFFEGGSMLMKTGYRTYDAEQWGQYGNVTFDLEQEVIPVPIAGVRASVPVPVELLREARDNCQASIAEDGISAHRKEYRIDLHKRLSALIDGVTACDSQPIERKDTDELDRP